MGDPLLWLLILMLGVLVVARRGRTEDANRSRPRLAYQRLEGRLVSLRASVADRSVPVESGAWTPLSLEDMPQEDRRRLVLHVAVDTARVPLDALERLVWALASVVQERAAAHAVVVEAFGRNKPTDDAADDTTDDPERLPGTGVFRLLFAPDGRGWSGDEAVIAAVDSDETDTAHLQLSEIHRKLLATLDGSAGAE